MIYTLEKRLIPEREPSQAAGWHYLAEDFAAWRGIALSKDTPRTSTDHEIPIGCECFQRLCGAGLCDIATTYSLGR